MVTSRFVFTGDRDLNESNASLDELTFNRNMSKTSLGSTTTISTTDSGTSRGADTGSRGGGETGSRSGETGSLASKPSSGQLNYKVRDINNLYCFVHMLVATDSYKCSKKLVHQ